ncbi:serine hydrolase [Lachnospiraceae bacterium 29-84]
MKCISKRSKKKLAKALVILLSFTSIPGCGKTEPLEDAYSIYDSTKAYGLGTAAETGGEPGTFFAEDLCVAGSEDVLSQNIQASLSEAAGLFNLKENTMEFGKNVHGQMYPASTTKILTAYVALKHGDLSEIATVTEAELELEPNSSVCGLEVGDKISLEELLYGLIICSGNDAANVIADLVSGSAEGFVSLMNEEAKALGATNSHFANPHGLQDESHYTTVYDMYLITQAAVKNEKFVTLISTASHTANLTNASGEPVAKEWTNTNRYLTGESTAPEGVTVVGGKTGTTTDAGCCLVLYSKKAGDVPYISIVFKAETKETLYEEMSELLIEISK